MRAAHASLLLLLLSAACAMPDEVPASAIDCVATHAVEDGYGHESDPPGCWGETTAGCVAPTLESVIADAAVDGFDLDLDDLITRDAALCIAAGVGLADGLDGPAAFLRWDQALRRPTWTVRNLLQQGDAFARGEYVLLDGLDGGVLESGEWIEESL